MNKPTPFDNLRSIILPFIGTIFVLGIFWFGYQTIFGPKKAKTTNFMAQSNITSPSSTPDSFTNNIVVPSAEVDSDNDGLSDAMEALYKTDPNNPDTDGDGYKDGDEVANGYDPLIKSPNDKIDRLATRLGTTALTPLSTSPLPSPSLTQLFVNKTGITPTDQNIQANEAQINQFINETNARGILPIILDSDIKIITATGKTAIVKYLDTLSLKTNAKLKAVTPEEITTAFTTLTSKKDSAPLDKIIANLKNNTQIFRDVSVPKEVAELHKKYLSAVVALQTNTETLKNYQTDYVSVLVAASRIEGLRAVFAEVGTEIKVLETKYGIK
ncbi:MAG: hypothetical protein Q7S57_06175 [bacterium]|nr:hypothetical protein [bacterium]